jgi:two-component system, chemotaxis family, protein-glutamate methylesterase/glutaminase
MSKIRVLIVDDAVVVRRILTDVLSSDPDIEVAGIAANGQIALAKVQQLNPDLLTMDVEMPTMNGLETVRALRKTHPKLPVIMFSTLTARGAEATLDALAAGANDYVTKPANVGSVSVAMERIREQLIPKIKALFGKTQGTAGAIDKAAPPLPPPKAFAPRSPGAISAKIEIVAIGTSTGGPNALAEVIPKLPTNMPVPIVIVQHMPPIFTKLLAERLAAQWKCPVKEAEAGDRIEPGHGYIAPGGFHMVLERRPDGVFVTLNQDPPENSCRPAVDVMMRSVARVYGDKSLAVILTGMGADGLRGCTNIREAGGRVLAQDEASSVVWGMPGFVAKAGLPEKVLPLGQVAPEIVRIVAEHRISWGPTDSRPPTASASAA